LYIHQIGIHLATLFFFLILFSFYNPRTRKMNTFETILLIFPIALFMTIIFTPVQIFTSHMTIFKLLNLLNLVLLTIYTLSHNKRMEYNAFLVILSVGFLVSYTYDLLTDNNIILYAENISSGFFIIMTLIYSSIVAFMRESEISSVEEIIQLNKKIRDTEFTFLNSQIQSHFIYNSLNSIQALINTNPGKAAELVEDFSTYLRTRLEFNKMPQLLNIEDELENIRTYLNIEKARFGKRVNYAYDLKVGDFLIPPLTVQPLVENAVKHGISMKKNGGTVTISTYEDENFIYIKVSDDGIGFDSSTLNATKRVGTENIRNRLNLHLNATLTIASQVNVGTESIIKIPKKIPIRKKSGSI
ncbi:MAG: histidine kinase, partial [Bacilli bacterium]|nr:histidine kinase [Bacilli bacterium]